MSDWTPSAPALAKRQYDLYLEIDLGYGYRSRAGGGAYASSAQEAIEICKERNKKALYPWEAVTVAAVIPQRIARHVDSLPRDQRRNVWSFGECECGREIVPDADRERMDLKCEMCSWIENA